MTTAHADARPEESGETQSLAGAETAARAVGWQRPTTRTPPTGDRRFSDPAWDENPWFLAHRQAYLAWSECVRQLPGAIGLEGITAEKATFALEQVGRRRRDVRPRRREGPHHALDVLLRHHGAAASPPRFVLSSSGHIAGIVNPRGPKRQHWTNEELAPEPAAWLAGAVQRPGTWWEDWADWIAARAGSRRPSHEMGSSDHPALADAPGTYVRQ